MQDIFGSEGPVMEFFRKTGLLIFASLLWLLGSLPVVTLGGSSAALYYTVVKSIRHERSHVHIEFWRAYKRNFKNGILLTIIYAFLGFMIYLNRGLILAASEGNAEVLQSYFLGKVGGSSVTVFVVLNGLAIVLLVLLLYLLPVMTRFEMKLSGLLKLAFYLAIRYFYFTIAMLLGLAVLMYGFVRFMPFPCLFFVPGIWTYATSYLVEKAMRPYMGEPKEGEDAWWLE
ncbi:MAG: YesL family protein [Lachnospiraceae bacterium]|nr:YesL family protein [Lachnospiraceae bacterium]